MNFVTTTLFIGPTVALRQTTSKHEVIRQRKKRKENEEITCRCQCKSASSFLLFSQDSDSCCTPPFFLHFTIFRSLFFLFLSFYRLNSALLISTFNSLFALSSFFLVRGVAVRFHENHKRGESQARNSHFRKNSQ